ncbi:hypothetical protein EF906_29550, partial [Streptomyces sp. WAC08241]
MGGFESTVPADTVRTLAARWLSRLGDGDFVVSPVGLWLALGAVAARVRTVSAGTVDSKPPMFSPLP